MIFKVLMGIAAIVGVLQVIRTSDLISKLIVFSLAASIALVFFPYTPAILIAFVLFGVTTLVIMVYTVMRKGFKPVKRIVLLLISFPVFLSHLFEINHWPFVSEIGLSMLVPILTFLIILIAKSREYKNEIGFLIILGADASIRLFLTVQGLGWLTT